MQSRHDRPTPSAHHLGLQRVPLVEQSPSLLVRLLSLFSHLIHLGPQLVPPGLSRLVLGVIQNLSQFLHLGFFFGDARFERLDCVDLLGRSSEDRDLVQGLFLIDQLEGTGFDLGVEGGDPGLDLGCVSVRELGAEGSDLGGFGRDGVLVSLDGIEGLASVGLEVRGRPG